MPVPKAKECGVIKLRFAESASDSDLNDISRLRRVREPVTRSQSGVRAKVADVLSGISRHAESQNELKGFQIIVATARADMWQEQPFTMEYRFNGAKHRYTPDILLVWDKYREVVEIKDDLEASLPENQKRFALIQELLSEEGYSFRVWRRSEIIAEPRLRNVGIVLRYRCIKVSREEQEAVRRIFSHTPRSTLRRFREGGERNVQSIFRLILDGSLHINWWEPLTLDSGVSTIPIGPRVWPFPLSSSCDF